MCASCLCAVAQLMDVVVFPSGKLSLVLECCATDLNRLLTHGMPLDTARALEPAVVKYIMRQLCAGLAHCHEAGVIHLVRA